MGRHGIGMNEPLFHRGHYNIIAAQFRRSIERIETKSVRIARETQAIDTVVLVATAILTHVGLMAVEMAKRLQQDNPNNFNPIDFLNACTPSTDRYPLAELWEAE
jgi:hypothetical protein